MYPGLKCQRAQRGKVRWDLFLFTSVYSKESRYYNSYQKCIKYITLFIITKAFTVDSQYFQEFVALLSVIKLEKLGNHQQKVVINCFNICQCYFMTLPTPIPEKITMVHKKKLRRYAHTVVLTYNIFLTHHYRNNLLFVNIISLLFSACLLWPVNNYIVMINSKHLSIRILIFFMYILISMYYIADD